MSPGTHRFVALDALRGLCAILVCLFHFRVNSPLASTPFIRASWEFVDFFFVLSGFVIAANYRQRLEDGLPPWRFIGLRFGRIYPLHIFVLGLFVATELAATVLAHPTGQRPLFDPAHAPVAILLHLTMLHSVGLTPRLTWNDPAWSIGVEFWAYVGFAVLVPYLRSRLEPFLVLVVVACPLILLFVTPFGINVTWDWGLIRCFYGFGLGVLCWAVWRRGYGVHKGGATVWTLVEVATVTAIVGFVVATRSSQWNLLGPPLFAAAVLVFAREQGWVSRVLATPPLLFLGTISYSVYMMHSFVQARNDDVLKLIEHRTGYALTTASSHNGIPVTLAGAAPLQGAVLTLVMLAMVIAVSYLTYRAIELPGQRWSRNLINPRPYPESAARQG